MPYSTKARNLKIGDIIQIAISGPYLSATVTKIEEKGIWVSRPYIASPARHEDEGDKMRPLTGIEEMFYHADDTVILWERVNGTTADKSRFHKIEIEYKR